MSTLDHYDNQIKELLRTEPKDREEYEEIRSKAKEKEQKKIDKVDQAWHDFQDVWNSAQKERSAGSVTRYKVEIESRWIDRFPLLPFVKMSWDDKVVDSDTVMVDDYDETIR